MLSNWMRNWQQPENGWNKKKVRSECDSPIVADYSTQSSLPNQFQVLVSLTGIHNRAAGSKARRSLYIIMLVSVHPKLVDLATKDTKDWPKIDLYSVLYLASVA